MHSELCPLVADMGEALSSSLLHVLTQADSWVEKEEPTPSN